MILQWTKELPTERGLYFYFGTRRKFKDTREWNYETLKYEHKRIEVPPERDPQLYLLKITEDRTGRPIRILNDHNFFYPNEWVGLFSIIPFEMPDIEEYFTL